MASMADQTHLIGYPPANPEVHDFLTSSGQVISHSLAISLVQHFLLALFNKTKEAIGCMGTTKSSQIQEFWNYMSQGQSMHSTGKNRSDFYKGVLALA